MWKRNKNKKQIYIVNVEQVNMYGIGKYVHLDKDCMF